MSASDVFARLVQQIESGEHVIVQFAAGDWALVRQFFEGTSAHETVLQVIPEAASVTIRVKPEELAAARAMASVTPSPAPSVRIPDPEPDSIDDPRASSRPTRERQS